MGERSLRRRVAAIAEEAGAEAIAVSYWDYETRTGWNYNGERWFHAASTIKVPVLLGVYHEIERGALSPESRLHVRNRFLSAADGMPYRVGADNDANGAVHASIGKTLKVRDLARHMIVTSSNLATNLLVDLVGIDAIRLTVRELGLEGIDFRRGVEDELAWEAGINNRVTADGLLRALRRIAERRAISADASDQMLQILHDQEFRAGIPAGLPDGARVANKTGEISTVAHDAGIIYLPDRDPYVLVVLTEWSAEATAGRRAAIARVSRTVFEHLTTDGSGEHG
jgi:beta-lactamase class A